MQGGVAVNRLTDQRWRPGDHAAKLHTRLFTWHVKKWSRRHAGLIRGLKWAALAAGIVLIVINWLVAVVIIGLAIILALAAAS